MLQHQQELGVTQRKFKPAMGEGSPKRARLNRDFVGESATNPDEEMESLPRPEDQDDEMELYPPSTQPLSTTVSVISPSSPVTTTTSSTTIAKDEKALKREQIRVQKEQEFSQCMLFRLATILCITSGSKLNTSYWQEVWLHSGKTLLY